MKICWDNLEGFKLTSKGNFKKYEGVVWDEKICKYCGESFLAQRGKNQMYCNVKCSGKANVGENNHFYGKKHTEETRKKMSENKPNRFGKNHPLYGKTGKNSVNWKGGIGIPIYDTYASKIEWCEEVRRSKKNRNWLEVRCSYNECRKWFVPKTLAVRHRMLCLIGKERGEQRFYCSEECKNKCSIYGMSPDYLMKADAVNAGRDPWWELPREVQPELRQIVLERDGYQCIKCGSKKNLHCHHIEGINHNPIMSADMDICITVCKECHKKIHQEKGCAYSDMKCNG